MNGLIRGRFDKVGFAVAGTATTEDHHEMAQRISAVLETHSALSQGITWTCGQTRLADVSEFRLERLRFDAFDQSARHEMIQRRLLEIHDSIITSDLSAGLLVSFGRAYYELYLLIDHIYFDGLSIDILESDLQSSWSGQSPRRSTYPSRSEQVEAQSAAVRDELARVDHLRAAQPVGDRPLPWTPAVARCPEKGPISKISLEVARTSLHDIMHYCNATEFQVIVTIYGLALAASLHSRDFVVAVPTAGLRLREPRVTSAIGCYTNTVYVRADMAGVRTLLDALEVTRRRLLDAIDSDFPAIMEIDAEFASVAAQGNWLIRRLNYPMIDLIDDIGCTSVIQRIRFPIDLASPVRRIMTARVRQLTADRLRISGESHAGNSALASDIAANLVNMLARMTECGPVSSLPLLSWLQDYEPATGSRVSRAGAGGDRVDPNHWLSGVLAGSRANEVVADKLRSATRRAGAVTADTSTEAVIRAYAENYRTAKTMPVELIRRDASPQGLARSRAAYDSALRSHCDGLLTPAENSIES